MDPGYWPQLANCLDDQLQFKRQPASSAIPIGSAFVSVRHQDVTSKSDLATIRISHRRIWMRIRDPGSDKRILTKPSIRILELYKHWLEHSSPIVPLRPRPLWSGFAAAQLLTFVALVASFALHLSNVSGFQSGLSLELLAQMAIVFTVARAIEFPFGSTPLVIILERKVEATNCLL